MFVIASERYTYASRIRARITPEYCNVRGWFLWATRARSGFGGHEHATCVNKR